MLKPIPKLHRSKATKIGILVALAVLIAVLAGVLWHKRIRHHFFPDNFGVVVPGRIYRSAYLIPDAIRLVHDRYDIRSIVDLGGSNPGTEEFLDEVETAEALGIKRFQFGLPGDGQGDPQIYVEVLKTVSHPDHQPVLVHCAAGAWRTSTVAIFYRNLFLGETVWEAAQKCLEYGYDPYEHPEHLAYIAQHLATVRAALGFSPQCNPPADDSETEVRSPNPRRVPNSLKFKTISGGG